MALRDQEDGIHLEEIETSASISTLRRWVEEFKHRGLQAAGALRSILYRHYNKFINELEAANDKNTALEMALRKHEMISPHCSRAG